jgi:hypothetical protein
MRLGKRGAACLPEVFLGETGCLARRPHAHVLGGLMSMGAGRKEATMKKKVLLADVMRWLRKAMEAAKEDPGDAGGPTSGLSYRELRVDIGVGTGGVNFIFVRTRNTGFSGSGWSTHRNVTSDGVVVLWEEGDIGIVTGTDWLPYDFVEWMRGG